MKWKAMLDEESRVKETRFEASDMGRALDDSALFCPLLSSIVYQDIEFMLSKV
jgi:hypothetical protein